MKTPSFVADKESQQFIESVNASIAAPLAEGPSASFAQNKLRSITACEDQCGDFVYALNQPVRNTSGSKNHSREING